MIAQKHDTEDGAKVPAHVLGLFAKYPRPGHVKTRLAAETSPEWAARVVEAFLLDLTRRLRDFPAQRILAFAPATERAYFANAIGDSFELVPQTDGDLGVRMKAFFDEHLLQAERVVLIGTDSPNVPLEYLAKALEFLNKVDVVLGPATDGGYYLVGCARRLPPIFENIEWSSPRVLAQTIACLPSPQWRLAMLPPWYDVDTLADWQVLEGQLAAQVQGGIDPELPLTRALMAEGATRLTS